MSLVLALLLGLDGAPDNAAYNAAERAYGELRAGGRRAAAAHFRDAIALSEEPPENWQAELRQLEKRWFAQVYAFQRADDIADVQAAAGVQTIGRSQSGADLAYRLDPLAERPVDVGVRLFAAHELNRVALAGETAQLAAGLRLHPVPDVNLVIAAERLIALGDAGRDSFLLRSAAGIGDGYGPEPGRHWFPHWQLYGEAGVVGLERGDIFANAQARVGYGRAVSDAATLTPTLSAFAQVQDDGRSTTLLEAGPGVWLKAQLGPVPVNLLLDYRLAVAGNADSSDSLTVTFSTGF